MKKICQIYIPQWYRSFKNHTLLEISNNLEYLKEAGFYGFYLIGLWLDGGYDNGFDIVEYMVNPKYGTTSELIELVIKKAHDLGLTVGVDVVPNHVSYRNILAMECLSRTPGFEDALYVVSKDEAEELTKAGVPSFFGKQAYSLVDGKYVRSTFVDNYQLNVNWGNERVQTYFRDVFKKLRGYGVDFARIDCGELLFEDVSKADPKNPLACLNVKASIEAVASVADGMPLFYECFFPETAKLMEGMPNCYCLDCSYVLTGQQKTEWEAYSKLVPLVGGHDQMTAADRGINITETLEKMETFEYGFLDMQTLIAHKTNPEILDDDWNYDADLKNPNQRYRARREIKPILEEFKKTTE